MPLDLPPKPELWLPPKPAIIRAASMVDLQREAHAHKRMRDAALAGTIFINPFAFAVAAVNVTMVSTTSADTATGNADQTTYSFAGLSLGTPVAGRVIVVAGFGRSSAARTVSSISAVGNAASLVVATNSGNDAIALYSIVDETNASGTVAITFSGGMLRAGAIVWAMTGASGATASATSSDSTISSGDLTTTLNVPANGAAIAAAWQNATAGSTWSWTAGPTEDAEFTIETTANIGTGASLEYAAAQTPLTVTAHSSDTGATSGVMVVGAWGP